MSDRGIKNSTIRLREHYLTPYGMYSLLDIPNNDTMVGYIARVIFEELEDVTPYTIEQTINKESIEFKITKKEEE